MKAATVRGYWSTNIGNSLFQISAQGLLKDLGLKTIWVPDVPGYINVKKGNPNTYFEFLDHLDIDFLCIQGPFFRKEFDRIYLDLLQKASSRGIKIIGLGVGAMHYDSLSIQYYKNWIEKINFSFISTRDRLTYDFLQPHIKNLHDGIDLGFLIRYYAPQPKFINNEKVVCFNFDQIPEIKLFKTQHGEIKIGSENYGYKKSFSGEPKGILKKAMPYILPYFKKYTISEIENFKIIRTDHRFNPYSRKKIYNNPNSFAMDTPDGYLLAYANSELTLSNRVHANVATLSYGNRAMYFSNSKRAKLIDRVGLGEIYNKPMILNLDFLEQEKSNLLEAIEKTI